VVLTVYLDENFQSPRVLGVVVPLVSDKVPKYMYTTVLIQKQGTHLGVADGELKLGHRQLRGLAVSVGAADHSVHQGRGGRLGDPLRRQGGAARHRGGSRWRAIPLGRPLDGPPFARCAASPNVRRDLLQHRCSGVPEPAAAPAAEGGDEEPDR
jgi:hypothetical protein